MTPRTKYKKAPLEYVILQVNHPIAPELTRGELTALKAQLITTLPLQSNEIRSQLDVTVPPGGLPAAQLRNDPVVRFSSRDRRTAVTFAPEAISLETSNYNTWVELRELVETVLLVRQDVAPVDGVERIGLRYIDEIRVPGDVAPIWSDWVNPDLAPPVLDVGTGQLLPAQQQSTLMYSTEFPNVNVTLRYGAMIGPSTVGDGPIARPSLPSNGPFFLVDTDASWSPNVGEEVPVVDATEILATGDLLHGYVKDLFEASLTDRLRTEVLNG